MTTFKCHGYRGMDTYKGEFTVEAETYKEAGEKAWAKRPFADMGEVTPLDNPLPDAST